MEEVRPEGAGEREGEGEARGVANTSTAAGMIEIVKSQRLES